jgi:transposase
MEATILYFRLFASNAYHACQRAKLSPFHWRYRNAVAVSSYFLPSYSPDLNPIEHWWHKIKTAIRKELPSYDFNIHQAADAAFRYL